MKYEKKIKKQDIILIAFILFVGCILLAITYFSNVAQMKVVVRVDNQVQEEFSIDEDVTYEIQGIGGKNVLRIEGKSVWMEDADCPDKICVQSGKIKYAGQSIICLPHKVVVEIKEAEYE